MKIRRIVSPSDVALPDGGRIYEGSIPVSERKPTSWLAAAATRSDFAVLVAEVDHQVVGFATVFIPSDAAALLEYLAVDSVHRSGGVGSVLFDAAVTASSPKPMLIEVELPVDEVTRRRIAFYTRCGCRMIEGLRYLLPLNTDPPPLVMGMMIVAGHPTPTRENLRDWLGVIYSSVYGKSADDKRLEKMLESLSDSNRL